MRISLLKRRVELLNGLPDLAVQKSDFLGQSSKGSFEVRLSFFSSSYGPDSKLCHGKFMAKVWADDHKNCLLACCCVACCSSSSTSFWLVSFLSPCYATKFSMNSKLWLCCACYYKMVKMGAKLCQHSWTNSQMREEWKSDKVTTF